MTPREIARNIECAALDGVSVPEVNRCALVDVTEQAIAAERAEVLRQTEARQIAEVNLSALVGGSEATQVEFLRGEVRRLREELATVTGQRDARTEELRLARNYMGALLGIIDGDRERVDSAMEILGCGSRSDLLDEAQAFVSAT